MPRMVIQGKVRNILKMSAKLKKRTVHPAIRPGDYDDMAFYAIVRATENYLKRKSRNYVEAELQPDNDLTTKKVRWLHASPRKLPKGTILTPGHKPSGNWSEKNMVFLSSSPQPHHTIVSTILEDEKTTWHIYEVEPLGKIFMGEWQDGAVDKAMVVRYIGTARGLLNRIFPHQLVRMKRYHSIGSVVRGIEIKNGRRKVKAHRNRMKEKAKQNR